jgi:26S proteasome regulatory subunit T3
MLVKAVANSTTASFIRVNGSEFVQKYLGEGPRMVRDVFRMARENSPAIIFIDEIDAIATKRFDAQTGADREVQRILLELLNQMDGFEQTSNVKVIMATNRADTLDPALLRPGRLDRKIEFPNLRDRRERRLIFTTIASKMSLSPEVDLDSLIVRNDPLSGAVIAAIMQEAGLRAVRKNRYNIIQSDLDDAYAAQVKSGQDDDRYVFFFPMCFVRVTNYLTVPTSTGKLLAIWGWVNAGGKSLAPTVVLSIICDTWEYMDNSSCALCVVFEYFVPRVEGVGNLGRRHLNPRNPTWVDGS